MGTMCLCHLYVAVGCRLRGGFTFHQMTLLINALSCVVVVSLAGFPQAGPEVCDTVQSQHRQ